ncbi:MAG TPA: SOS response-associated peptidase family protein [Stenotrophomonas sp.]|nr:SOS response-associated peptidase family protein [Stenotrophomonas sp.]
MCYSAEIQAEYKKLVRQFGAIMDYDAFAKLWLRQNGAEKHPRTPKALEDAFAEWTNNQEHEVWKAIRAGRGDDLLAWEVELFNQQRRIADAERRLASKPTKTAQTELERATRKKTQVEGWLADLRRQEPRAKDFRIFPGWWAPVVVSENGQRVIRPMRYQCRPPMAPVSYDKDYPGTYNARRDNLERAWKDLFGYRHGLIVVRRFYENVEGPDGKNVVFQFQPRDKSPMLVACLWSHWKDPQGVEPDLYSFAAITDEPEPEVAEAGHDRTIINIKPEHVDAWLNPDPNDLAAMHEIFDDKMRPYYEHKAAA